MQDILPPIKLIFVALLCGVVAATNDSSYAQALTTLEVISASNLDRLEQIASWQPDGHLLSEGMSVTPARDANVILIENRFENLLGTIDLDRMELGPVFPFAADPVINRTAISPDGKYAAVQDYTAFDVWDTSTGKSILRIKLSQADSEVNDLVFSPSSGRFAYIASGYPTPTSQDGVYIYDLSSGKQVTMFEHQTVTKAAFSPNEDYVVSGGHDGSLRIWNLHTNQFEEIRKADQNSIDSLDFADESLFAVSIHGDNANSLEYWDIKQKQQLSVDNFFKQSSVYLKNGISRVPLDNYRFDQYWSVFRNSMLAFVDNEGYMDLSVKQNLLITSGLNGTVGTTNFRALDTGKLLHTLNDPDTGMIHFSFDGRYLIFAGYNYGIKIWGIPSG